MLEELQGREAVDALIAKVSTNILVGTKIRIRSWKPEKELGNAVEAAVNYKERLPLGDANEDGFVDDNKTLLTQSAISPIGKLQSMKTLRM